MTEAQYRANHPAQPGRPGPDSSTARVSAPPSGAVTDANTRTDAGSGGQNIQGIRAFLRSQGYKIQESGPMDGILRSALKDWHQTKPKDRNPGAWNAKHSLISNGKLTKQPGGGRELQHPPGAGAPDTGMGLGGTSNSWASIFAALDPNVGTPFTIPEGGSREMDPNEAANTAGMGFDSSIAAIKAALERNPRQEAQNLHDISTWYGQAQGTLGKSTESSRQMTEAGVSSVSDAVAKIISSLGGEANQGSPMVGAAGANATGFLQAIGNINDQFNQGMAPLLDMEKAGEMTREQARMQLGAADLSQQLAGILGDQGAAKAGARFDTERYNNEIRDRQVERQMRLQEGNNALAQQAFGNKFGIASAGVAASQFNRTADLNEFETLTGMQPEPQGWAALSQTDRSKLATDIISGARTTNKDGLPVFREGPGATWSRIIGVLKQRDLDPFSPAGRAFLKGIAQALHINVGKGGNPSGPQPAWRNK